MEANGIGIFWENDDTDFMFEMLSEDDGSDPEDWKDRMKLLASYQDGKIGRLLKRVESNLTIELPKALESYTSPERV